MKALDLTVYPTFWLSGKLLTTAAPGATISDPIDVDYWAACKRLTDAELAAEVFSAIFHEAECEVRGRRIERGYPPHPGHPAVEHYVKQNREFGRQAGILERFAMLPHYDEKEAAQ